MKQLSAFMGAQVRRPSGLVGRLLGHTMARGHRPLTEWTINLMNIQPSSQVLDVGCGSGMAMRLIGGAADAGFIAGVDYSPAMVRQARRRNAVDMRSGRMAVLHGDVVALPFPDGSFDRLSAIETFYFWPQPLACLTELRRVLRPGGLAAITMEMSKEEGLAAHSAADTALAYGFTIYSAAEMEQMLRQAGFIEVRCVCEPLQAAGWLCALGVAT